MLEAFRYTWLRLSCKLHLSDETGASAVEYGVMVALIAAVIVAVVATLGGQIKDAFQTVVDELTPAP